MTCTGWAGDGEVRKGDGEWGVIRVVISGFNAT